MRECKRCFLRDAAELDAYESVQSAIKRLKESEKVSQEDYHTRLSECSRCDNLISGVCMKCGCYVELRAAFKIQKCPDAKNRKW